MSTVITVTTDKIQEVRDKARNLQLCHRMMYKPGEANTYASAVLDTLDFLLNGGSGMEAALQELNTLRLHAAG